MSKVLRRVPSLHLNSRVILIVLLSVYLACTCVQSFILPIFEGPDEQKHYAYVRYLVNSRTLPPLVKSSDDTSRSYGVGQMAGNPPLYYAMVTLATAFVPDADAVGPYVDPNEFWSAYDVTGAPYDNHIAFLHGREGRFPFQGASLAVRLGRLVSVALGSITLLGMYGIGRAVAPTRPGVALLSVALGCLPQFVFLNSAITPDVGVITFATLTIWIIARIVREGATLRLAALGGVLTGLTVLCKINGAWIGIVLWLALIGAQWIRRDIGDIDTISSDQRATGWRFRIAPLVVSLSLCVAIAGWWFVRGVTLAGDPLGVRIHAVGEAQSPLKIAPQALSTFGIQLGNLEKSFWFNSGWAGLVPAPTFLLTTYRAIYFMGLAGLVGLLAQWFITRRMPILQGDTHDRCHPDLENRVLALQLLCLACCCAFALAGAMYWILVYIWSIGRLMFPALGAAATLGALGYAWWFDRLRAFRAAKFLYPLGMVALGAALLNGTLTGVITTTRTLNPHPSIRPMEPDDVKTQVTFVEPADGSTPIASIVGYNVPQMDFRSDGALYAHVCWQSHGFQKYNLPYSIQLVGPHEVRPGTRNSYHGLGTYPLLAWQPDETFCDPVALKIDDVVDRPRAYLLLVSMFTYTQGVTNVIPLRALDGNGNPTRPVIGRVRVAPRVSPPMVNAPFRLADVAGLADAQVQLARNDVLSVTLRWVALNQTPDSLIAFMHVYDASTGKLIAQSDHVPDDGWFPTNYWWKGDVIDDHFQIVLPEGTNPNRLRLAVGMYEAQTQQRLPAWDVQTGERLKDDLIGIRIESY